MSWLTISGMAFGSTRARDQTAEREFSRQVNGGPMTRAGLSNRLGGERSYTSGPLSTEVAQFWLQFFGRRGNVWDFENNDDVSSTGVKTIDAITPATDNAKWGTYHADRTGSDIDIAKIEDNENFTIIYWWDDGTGYVHVVSTQLPADSADRIWVDGVRNDAYSQPHNITGDVLTLDTNGDFDDIVILPFGMPTEIASQVTRIEPFSSLPKLDLRGDGLPHRVVEVINRPSMRADDWSQGDAVWRVSFECRASSRPAISFEPDSTDDMDFWIDVSDIYTLWQDTGRTTQVAANGDPIQAIDDKSGNGNNFAYVTAAPAYRPTGFRSRFPAAEFAGGSEEWRITSLTNATPQTLFVVADNDDTTLGYMASSGSGGSVRVLLEAETSGAPVGPGFYDGAHKAFGASLVDTPVVYEVLFEAGGTARLFINGTEHGSGTAYTGWNNVSVLFQIGGSAVSPDFNIAEMRLYNIELTDQRRALIREHLLSKWGLA